MKYLILIHHNHKSQEVWARLSDDERAEGIGAHADLVEDLTESGEMVVSEALADPSQAKRVLVGGGRTTTSDGPFPEMKEHLAGFYLVECESIDRAVEHAARIPEAALGMVEVRPVLTPNGPDM
ncbi:YciI family protein [Actinomadura scrupuli]|uniref:YciI family protein n=1 Tax=Actinomadura scrupuli TaxID=559629 RepID=UPI003D9841B7